MTPRPNKEIEDDCFYSRIAGASMNTEVRTRPDPDALDARLSAAFGNPHPVNWPDPPHPTDRKFGKALARFNADLEEHNLPTFSERAVEVFWQERAKGQDVYEDCGGFLLRPWLVALGSRPAYGVTTHQDFAAQLVEDRIDKLSWQVRDTCARAEKAEALLRECDEAINPPDRGGISLDQWDQRLKAVTAKIRDLFKAETRPDLERIGSGPKPQNTIEKNPA